MGKPRITETDLCRAAKRAGTSTAEIETFLDVETKGKGFDEQDRPVILFERHWFHKLTKGNFDKSHRNISNPIPGGYGKSSEQYDRFDLAYQLDPQAAMKSASWGLGQVMGFNYAICGYSSVGEFVDAMKESEGKQLDAAIEFIVYNKLDDELRRHDWRGFARGYNGPNYEKNDYDAKLATAYAKFSKRKINCSNIAADSMTAPDPTARANANDAANDANSTEPDVTANPAPALIVVPPQPKKDAVQVKPETTSIWVKIGAAVTFLTGTGLQIGALVQEKISALTVNQTLYLIAALGLCVLAVWWYRKEAKGAQMRTLALVETAADPSKNTVELKK